MPDLKPYTSLPVNESSNVEEKYLKKYKEELEEKKKEIENEQKEIDKLLTKKMEVNDMIPQKSLTTPEQETSELSAEPKKEEAISSKVEEEIKPEEIEKEEGLEETSSEPVTASFNLRFKKGDSIKESYFIADDGKEIFTITANEILPPDVIAKIEANDVEDIVTPDELIFQIKNAGVDSVPKFKEVVASIKETVLKRTASTPPIVSMQEEGTVKVKKDEDVTMSMNKEEAKVSEKYHPLPSQIKSKVKQYYGRLPGAGGGEVEQSLNPQSNSSLLEQIELLRKALADQVKETEETKKELSKVKEEKGGLEKEKAMDNKAKIVESIIKELISKKLIMPDKEDKIVDILTKIDEKVLPLISSLIKEFSASPKGKEEEISPFEMGKGMGPGEGKLESKPGKLIGAPEELGAKASAKVPPIFISNEDSIKRESPEEFLSKSWNLPGKD